MSFVLLPALLKRNYGHNADSLERMVEVFLAMFLLFGLTVPNPLPFCLLSAVATAAMGENMMSSSWHRWAGPPIALDKRILVPSFIAISLIHLPSLVTVGAALVLLNPLLLVPQLVVALTIVIARAYKPQRKPVRSYRFVEPRAEGPTAYLEFLVRRLRFPINVVTCAVVAGIARFVVMPGRSLLPWLLAGASFGVTFPIIYRERDDLPAKAIRITAQVSRLWGILPRAVPGFCFILLAALFSATAGLIVAWFILLVAIFLIRRIVTIEPSTFGNLRFLRPDLRPSPLPEFFMQLFLLALFATSVWVFA